VSESWLSVGSGPFLKRNEAAASKAAASITGEQFSSASAVQAVDPWKSPEPGWVAMGEPAQAVVLADLGLGVLVGRPFDLPVLICSIGFGEARYLGGLA
jgi:hypothetical protein